MKKEDSGNTLGTREKKLEATRGERKLPTARPFPLTEIKRWKDRSEEECVPEGEEAQKRQGRGKRIGGQGTCVRWTWVRPAGTSCSPSRLPINQTRPNA